MKKIEELKKWIDEHKTVAMVAGGATIVLTVVGGVIVGKKIHVKNLKKTASKELVEAATENAKSIAESITDWDKFTLTDAWDETWDNGLSMIVNDFKVKDMGEVGEQIVTHCGVDPDSVMTAMISTTGDIVKDVVEEAVSE